jgi:glycosyltransferase involved in cell wall biosynthesis
MKTRILFVNYSDSRGGAAKACYRLFSYARENGLDVKMLVREKLTDDADIYHINDFSENGLSGFVEKIIWKINNRFRKSKWKKYPGRENVFLNDLASVNLKKAFHFFKPDVIHLHFVANRFLNLKDLVGLNSKIIWTLHDSWAFTGICHFFYNCKSYENSCGKCFMLHSDNAEDLSHEIWKKKAEIYKKLKLNIVTPSRWLGQCASNSSLLKKFPVDVIPNGISRKIFFQKDKQEARLKLNLDQNRRYLLFGAYQADTDKNKGFHFLKSAIGQLPDNKGITLIVYGADIKAEFPEIPVPVINYGYIADEIIMADLYNAADMTIVPSLSENLSFTIMESMSCGTPVIAFDTGGNADIIDHKKNGYLATSFDEFDLMQGILWGIRNSDNTEIIEFCQQQVLNHFTEEISGNQYLEMYNKILKEQ